MLITIIGRGHSGTRSISHTLSASGVFMGEPLNVSGDLLPPQKMYDACRVFTKYVTYEGNNRWDFSKVRTCEIPGEFKTLIEEYLHSVLSSDAAYKGWKIPETTLVYPWIVRMFPDIRYIFWVRDPRDCILGSHLTDDLGDFGIPYEKTGDVRHDRAVSWLYTRCTSASRTWSSIRTTRSRGSRSISASRSRRSRCVRTPSAGIKPMRAFTCSISSNPT